MLLYLIPSRGCKALCDNTKSKLHAHVLDAIDKTQQTEHMQCIYHVPSGSVKIVTRELTFKHTFNSLFFRVLL